jgi:perosamine synthetase
MKDFIPVNEPLLNGNEKKYLIKCIETGWISSEGPFVKLFEQKLASFVGRKYGVALTNGTAALDVAIETLGIKAGDEVILPTFTIISCILQIVRKGAKPVLIDSDPLTWNMNINQIESKITKKTKAILVVHIYGLPIDMDPVIEICKKYKLKLIEDSAEQIGQTYKKKQCGSFGDISTMSFYTNKHITTGEGGMIFTDNEEYAIKFRKLRNLYFQEKKRFIHEEIGWNLRMTNLQASIGVAQLERIDEFIKKKKWLGAKYHKKLCEVNGLQLPVTKTDYADNIYWVFGLVLKDSIRFNASEIMQMLFDNKIGSRPFFFPMHQQPIFKKLGLFKNETYPVAENLYNRGFYLPSGLALTNQQIERVTSVLKKILKKR